MKEKFETLQLHAGQEDIYTYGARAVPIFQTASYVFPDTQTAEDFCSMKQDGFVYSRNKNPTHDVLEKRIAKLEGGVAGVATSSGMAAQTSVFTSLVSEPGQNIVSSSRLYGGSSIQLHYTLVKLGIQTKFAESDDTASFETHIDDNTRGIFIETIGNPHMNVLDIEALGLLAAKYEIPLIVDNTFGAGGYICRPIDFGANIITHSATKWIGGHGTSIGGLVVDAGNFDWSRGKFPQFSEPSPMNHGLVFCDKFGNNTEKNVVFAAFLKREALMHIGASLSPFNSFLLLQGIETLSLRVERHCENANKVAEFLSAQPQIEWVQFPGLDKGSTHNNAKKYFRLNCFGSMISCGLVEGKSAGRAFIENLKLFSHLANVGDAKSLAIHPASTTHAQLSEEELLACGVRPEMLRLSIGTEHIDDIIADLAQALKVI